MKSAASPEKGRCHSVGALERVISDVVWRARFNAELGEDCTGDRARLFWRAVSRIHESLLLVTHMGKHDMLGLDMV